MWLGDISSRCEITSQQSFVSAPQAISESQKWPKLQKSTINESSSQTKNLRATPPLQQRDQLQEILITIQRLAIMTLSTASAGFPNRQDTVMPCVSCTVQRQEVGISFQKETSSNNGTTSEIIVLTFSIPTLISHCGIACQLVTKKHAHSIFKATPHSKPDLNRQFGEGNVLPVQRVSSVQIKAIRWDFIIRSDSTMCPKAYTH